AAITAPNATAIRPTQRTPITASFDREPGGGRLTSIQRRDHSQLASSVGRPERLVVVAPSGKDRPDHLRHRRSRLKQNRWGVPCRASSELAFAETCDEDFNL